MNKSLQPIVDVLPTLARVIDNALTAAAGDRPGFILIVCPTNFDGTLNISNGDAVNLSAVLRQAADKLDTDAAQRRIGAN